MPATASGGWFSDVAVHPEQTVPAKPSAIVSRSARIGMEFPFPANEDDPSMQTVNGDVMPSGCKVGECVSLG